MSDDLVTALRAAANTGPTPGVLGRTGYIHVGPAAEAADEIERLRDLLKMVHGNLLGEAELHDRHNPDDPFRHAARLRELASLLDQKEQSHD